VGKSYQQSGECRSFHELRWCEANSSRSGRGGEVLSNGRQKKNSEHYSESTSWGGSLSKWWGGGGTAKSGMRDWRGREPYKLRVFTIGRDRARLRRTLETIRPTFPRRTNFSEGTVATEGIGSKVTKAHNQDVRGCLFYLPVRWEKKLGRVKGKVSLG